MRRNCQGLPLLHLLRGARKMNHLIHQIHSASARLFADQLPRGRACRSLPTHAWRRRICRCFLPAQELHHAPGHHQLQEELRTLLRIECPRASMVLAADSRTGSPSISDWISFIRLEDVNRTGRHCPRGACASAQCPSPNPAPAPQTRGSGSHRADSPRRTSARDRQPDR